MTWSRGLLFALPLVILFGPELALHVGRAADPHRFADDARQHFGPFVCELEGLDCSDDFVFRYLAARLPVGARALYSLGDPRATGKVLPFVLLGITLAALAAAAWHLGGMGAAFGALALALADPNSLGWLAGALPRSFGLPLVALGALALARGSPLLLAASAVAGAAFYLPVGVLLAAALALQLLAIPEPDGKERWSARRRFGWLVATGILMLLLTAPVVVALQPFGSLIGPDEIAAFPEAGEGGRMRAGNRLTDRPEGGAVFGVLAALLRDLGDRIPPWFSGAVLLGLLGASLRQRGARRLLTLPLAMAATYVAATWLLPHLYAPGRYLDFALGPLTALGLGAGFAALFGALVAVRAPPWSADVLAAAACLLVALTVVREEPGHGGLTIHIPPADRELHTLLAGLPPDVRIAGWPTGPVDTAPYVTGRRVLVTREVHNPFHRAYVLELRARTEAFIDAYFATDAAPLERLRDEFGVTHLLIDFSHYEGDPPAYFDPFAGRIRAASGRGETLANLRRIAVHAAVWQHDHYALIDLARVRAP